MPKSEVFTKQESAVDLLLDVDQRPSLVRESTSVSSTFAMFGNHLVPLILNASYPLPLY